MTRTQIYVSAILLLCIAVALYSYCVRDIKKRMQDAPVHRKVWLELLLFFPIIGSVLYLLSRNRRPKDGS